MSLEDVYKLERFYDKFDSQEELKFPVMVDKDMGVIIH